MIVTRYRATKPTNLAASFGILAGAVARVHCDGLADDQTVLDETTDVLPGVGVGDLVDLIRIEPDLVLATLEHLGGEALLHAQITEMVSISIYRK